MRTLTLTIGKNRPDCLNAGPAGPARPIGIDRPLGLLFRDQKIAKLASNVLSSLCQGERRLLRPDGAQLPLFSGERVDA